MNSSRKYTVIPRDDYMELRRRHLERTMMVLLPLLSFMLVVGLAMLVFWLRR